jgi:hypothetical protein
MKFPNNWPLTTATYIPNELTPFGPWSFGTSPGNPLRVKKNFPHTNVFPIQYSDKTFQLNGRLCNVLSQKKIKNVPIVNKAKQVILIRK